MTLSVGEEAAAEETDCIIVGAGPTGLACGIELKKLGIKAVLIDKGCVVNSLYNYPTNMVFFTTPELLEIGGIPMTSLNEKPGRTEALKYYRRVADHFHLDIRQYQTVKGISGDDGSSLRGLVTTAAGIATRARSGEVLVSSLVREIVASRGDQSFAGSRSITMSGLLGEFIVHLVRF